MGWRKWWINTVFVVFGDTGNAICITYVRINAGWCGQTNKIRAVLIQGPLPTMNGLIYYFVLTKTFMLLEVVFTLSWVIEIMRDNWDFIFSLYFHIFLKHILSYFPVIFFILIIYLHVFNLIYNHFKVRSLQIRPNYIGIIV